MEKDSCGVEDSVVLEEILSLLQEKRTALKAIRIGLATIVTQISLLGFLIAAPAYQAFIQVRHWIILFAALNSILVGLAAYLLVGPLIHMHRLNQNILKFKQKHRQLGCHESR